MPFEQYWMDLDPITLVTASTRNNSEMATQPKPWPAASQSPSAASGPSTPTPKKRTEASDSYGAMYPMILTSPATLEVLTWDDEGESLHIHTAIYHLHKFPLEIVNSTIIFPTSCWNAAGLLLRYCYNNGCLTKEILDQFSAGVLRELWLLACRLEMETLAGGVGVEVAKRVKGASVAELCDYTRICCQIAVAEKNGNTAVADAVQAWLENEERLQAAMSDGEGELQSSMIEYPEFALALLDEVMKRSRLAKKRKMKAGKA